MKKKDIKIISYLRQNGRISLRELSRRTKIPMSTAHERLKQITQEKIIKPTITLDYEKIGYAARAQIMLAAEEREKLIEHLRKHPNVNTLYRINNGWNIMAECIFKDMNLLEDFIDKIDNLFHIKQKQVHYIIAEIQKEKFLTQPEIAEQMINPAPRQLG